MLAAHIMGKAAVIDGKNALQTQAYGAEARGSLAKSEVVISDDRIGFPGVRRPDILAVMSQDAADTLVKDLKENGLLIVDSSNAKNIPSTQARVVELPVTETAKTKLGDAIFANIVLLGVLIAITRIVSNASVEAAIEESVSKGTVTKNTEAFRLGIHLASEQRTDT